MNNPEVRNKFGEKIDTLVEGKMDADTTVVFVHGNGTDKNEGGNLFVDIANGLADKFRIVRFDFTGFGKSEGKQEDVDFKKEAGDLESVLDYVRQNFPGKINIIAHSMGTTVTSMLLPEGINDVVYTGISGTDRFADIERTQRKIISRGGVVDEGGISLYPRTAGGVQKVGPSFWKIRREFDYVKALREYVYRTNLVVFKPMQDDVVGNDGFEEYKNIKGMKHVELNGSHGFSNPQDRQELIRRIKEFFSN